MGHDFESEYIPYSATGKFHPIILHYLDQSDDIRDFFSYPANLKGIQAVIERRKQFAVDRKLLTEELRAQYQDLDSTRELTSNINALLDENTFTICTAHQPNILTGHLYFIYKILHTIRLAQTLKGHFPQYNFVPVYFMGSEDADLEELNHLYVDGHKYIWDTKQTGAFGRMKVDAKLLSLLEDISGRLAVEKHGPEVISLLKECFVMGTSVEHSTFLLVHHLFKEYGLVVFLPDNPAFKKAMLPFFKEDLFYNRPSGIVNDTIDRLGKKFKVQANPRDINLFYLRDSIRNRIVKVEDHFVVHDTDLVFDRMQMEKELEDHPDRFSPNVILRALFQEVVLPDLAFIGGGGEMAYWFELKDMFDHYQIPFPLLVLRNSFLVIERKYHALMKKLGISAKDLFQPAQILINALVLEASHERLDIDPGIKQMREVYQLLGNQAAQIDVTLKKHVEALETVALKKLSGLGTKMLRAERRKFAEQKRQVEKLKAALFPDGNLQERTENFMLLYAKLGHRFIELIFENSLDLEQQFCVLMEKDSSKA